MKFQINKDKIITYCILFIWCLLIFFSIFSLINPEWVRNIPEQKNNEIRELMQLADIDIYKGNYNNAINKYIRVLKIKPDMVEATIKLSSLYESMGNTGMSTKALNQAIKQNPIVSYLIYYNLAEIYINNSQINEAINCYIKALETEPFVMNTYIKLGEIYKKVNNWELLINALQNAIKKRSDIKEFYVGMLKRDLYYYADFTDVSKAIQFQLDKGINEKDMKNYDKNIFQKVLNRDKDLAIIHNKIAYAYAAKGDINNAVLHFRKAIQIWPEYVDANNNLKYILANKKKL